MRWATVATIDMGQKEGAAVPLSRVGGAGSLSNTMSTRLRPTSVPSGILMHTAAWPQSTWAENWGLCQPLPRFGEQLGPHLSQCDLGRGLPPYEVAPWCIQPPFGYNRNGPKIGVCVPFFGKGKLGPHLAKCGLDQGPPPYEVPSWSIQPFGHNSHGPKIGDGGLSHLFGDRGSCL